MSGTFSCTLKFIVKDCDPNTGEADDEGYEDEYVVGITGVFIPHQWKFNWDKGIVRMRQCTLIVFSHAQYLIDPF